MKRTIFWLTAFSIAMAYLETSVVIYLRLLLYPEGFDFPLKPINNQIVVVELWREAATMIMLVGAGIMSGRNGIQRFACFIYSFAIWDIFYYVFLKIFIDWPASLMTWDVLFLIPVTWTGPVLTPVIISLLMIILSMEIVLFDRRLPEFRINRREWLFLICGSIVVIVAFCWDYSKYILSNHEFSKIWSLTDRELFDLSVHYIPESFNWLLFNSGVALIILSMSSLFLRSKPKIN